MPERTCVGCRGKAEKAELTRVVFDGARFAIDHPQTAPGRGAYLHPQCGSRALKTRALPRALRVTTGSPAQLADVLAELARQGPAWAKPAVGP